MARTEGDIRHWLLRASAALPLFVGALVAVGLVGVLLDPVRDKRAFTAFLFVRQDLAPALLLALLMRYALRPDNKSGMPGWSMWLAQRPWILACLLIAACWAGQRWLLQGYDLTRDEQMATLDASIYAQGRLSWPIAPQWRPFANALNQFFILPIFERQAWVSDYLPVNALAHAVAGKVGASTFVSPLFTGIGALALWRVALRLWPDDRQSMMVALLLYAGSSQVVVQGMTTHAMAGHLALNLMWLLLFLRGGWSHVGAIITGFLATGLHQPIFHPLFVFPVLATLVLERRWRLAAIYAAAYAAIGFFWFAWPHIVVDSAGGPLIGASSTGDRLGYGDRIAALLHDAGPINLWLMAMNMIRFLAWQHILFLPLVAAGATLAWRQPLVRPLVAGILLHILLAGLLLAYQGHGWGYRYLHGVVGSACIVGVNGWRALRPLWPSGRLWNWTNALSFGALVPVHMAMMAWLTLPYAQVSRSIDRVPTDVVIIDDRAVAFGSDLVINRADLSNRPIRLLASALSPEDIEFLCSSNRTEFVGSEILSPIAQVIPADPGNGKKAELYNAQCRTRR